MKCPLVLRAAGWGVALADIPLPASGDAYEVTGIGVVKDIPERLEEAATMKKIMQILCELRP